MRGHKKNYLKKQAVLGAQFIVSIVAFYTLLWLALQQINLYFLKAATAWAANVLLNILGVPTALQFLAEPSIIIGRLTAQITNLCAGDIEIILMTAIILSTFDRSWRQRLFGVLGGILIVLVINPLRIAAVLAVGYYSSWQWADFTHDVLFRLTLLAVIIGYYYIWYMKYGSIAKLIKRK